MVLRRVTVPLFLLCLTSLAFSACLARRRGFTRPGGKVTQTLLLADQETLLRVITRQYTAVHDFNATVDMVPAQGSAEKNHITEYKDVRAFILFRKAADIRVIGLLPVVRNKAFDMVSNGTSFKLYLPTKSRFITGSNGNEQLSENKLENLRPQQFLDALVVRPVDILTVKLLLENFTDEDNAFYIIHEIRESADGKLNLLRTIWFNRLDLQLARQLIFDGSGNILSDARYAEWKAYDNVPFPKHIEINWPREESAVVIDVVKMDINKGVSDDKFVLQQPEGTALQILGQPPTPGAVKPATIPPKGPEK